MMKSYVCNRFPYFRIGKQINFQDGRFDTDKPAIQEKIEAHEDFGVHIFERDTDLEESLPEVVKDALAGQPVFIGVKEPAAPETAPPPADEFIKVQGKDKAAEMEKLYGPAVSVAGNWYTFKKGAGHD